MKRPWENKKGVNLSRGTISERRVFEEAVPTWHDGPFGSSLEAQPVATLHGTLHTASSFILFVQ